MAQPQINMLTGAITKAHRRKKPRKTEAATTYLETKIILKKM